jgi:hypothetical protein
MRFVLGAPLALVLPPIALPTRLTPVLRQCSEVGFRAEFQAPAANLKTAAVYAQQKAFEDLAVEIFQRRGLH